MKFLRIRKNLLICKYPLVEFVFNNCFEIEYRTCIVLLCLVSCCISLSSPLHPRKFDVAG
jgi:hypothetical protein